MPGKAETMASTDDLLADLRRFYDGRVRSHGPTPAGLDYNSEAAQTRRFEQLAKLLPRPESFSLLDYGCGYGSLYRYLRELGLSLRYRGFDISAEMLAQAKAFLSGETDCEIFSEESALPASDFTVACGIFNNKLEIPEAKWQDHVLTTLHRICDLSRKGFAFNMLTSYSDPEKMRPDLYYGDPCFYFDYCKKNFAKDVALLHDYGLYDFTILVRLAP